MQPSAKALVVSNGTTIVAGSETDIRDLASKGTRLIDATGGTVLLQRPRFAEETSLSANSDFVNSGCLNGILPDAAGQARPEFSA